MNNNDFSPMDNVPLSLSDSALIAKLIESDKDSTNQAALREALNMLVKQRNMLAYRVSELEHKAIAVQSDLEQKATTLQTQLDYANAAVELQYCASLGKDDMREALQQAGSPLPKVPDKRSR